MSRTLSVLVALAFLLVITAPAAVASEAAPSAKLAVTDVRFAPISTGKNVVSFTVRNLTDQAQVLMVDIRTQPAPQSVGWQTQFTEQLAPRARAMLRFGFSFTAMPAADGFVRVRCYDSVPTNEQQSAQFFQEVRRLVSEIGRQETPPPASAASPQLAKAVRAQFARFQRLVQDRKYREAWPLLTRTHRQAAFFDRLSDTLSFTWYLDMDPSPTPWSRADIIRLQPGEVRIRGETAILDAKLGEAVWSLEFAQEDGEWRLDWVNGWPPLPSPRDRNARLEVLLPRLQKRTTPHFDIYCRAESSAARDMDRIVAQREAGYQAIREFLGLAASPRIRLVFFEDADTKQAWLRHQGGGLAYGTTIVEVYNQETRLDPFHEAAHILAGPLGDPPALFQEGFAVYMSERLGAPPVKTFGGGDASTYARVKQLKGEGRWIPLAELLTYTEIGSAESQPDIAYPEAGAFVKFLVDSYGRDAFVATCKQLHNSDDSAVRQRNAAALERATGKSLSELSRAWLGAMGLEEAKPVKTAEAVNLKPFVAPAEPLPASYAIDVKLDPEQKRLAGTETIRLTNRSPLTLATLALEKSPGGGSFEVMIAGVRPAVVPDPDEAAGDAPLLVALPAPLAPGQTVELKLTFQAPIKLSSYGDWRLTDWHPKLWWGYPTRDNYAVKIGAPAGWNLAASGRLGADGVWQVQGARSFGIVTAQEYQQSEAEAGDVHLRALYRPAGKQCAELVLKTAVDVIGYYRERWGFYPQPFLAIVPGMARPAGGYPVATGIVAIHGEEQFANAPLDHWRWITSHEIGHQYWGEYVFSDDLFDHWLLIGLGIAMDRGYARTHGVSPQVHQKLVDRYLAGIAEGDDTTAELPEEQVARASFDRNNVVIHGKGYAIVSALQTVIGEEAFARAVRACLKQFAGKRMTALDLQRACEAASGQDLAWFFRQWTQSNRQLAYRIASQESVKEGARYRTRVLVERTGTLAMPVPVEARFADGTTQRASTDQSAARWELRFESASPLKDVVLDPEGALPVREAPVIRADDEIAGLGYSGGADKARAILAKVRQSGLADPEGWFKLGLNLYDGRFYPEALEAFQRFCTEAKGSQWRVFGIIWQGHLLDLTDRRQEALACYQEAKQSIGTNSMQHDQWGMVLDANWVEQRLKTPFARK